MACDSTTFLWISCMTVVVSCNRTSVSTVILRTFKWGVCRSHVHDGDNIAIAMGIISSICSAMKVYWRQTCDLYAERILLLSLAITGNWWKPKGNKVIRLNLTLNFVKLMTTLKQLQAILHYNIKIPSLMV